MASIVTRPEQKAVTTASGTASSNGNNTLVAAVAGKAIVIVTFTMQNESTTATTLLLTDGVTTLERVLGQNQGDGVSKTYPADARKRTGVGLPLILNLSGANSCGYTVEYYTE
jgi:hypothetical protein